MNFEGMIWNLANKFSNICTIDPAQTVEDLRSEARVIYLELLQEPVPSYAFSTILYRKVEQRFTDLYRKVRRRADTFIDADLFTPPKEVWPLEGLPPKYKKLAEAVMEHPGELSAFLISKNKNLSKTSLTQFLVQKKNWRRCTALNTVSDLLG